MLFCSICCVGIYIIGFVVYVVCVVCSSIVVFIIIFCCMLCVVCCVVMGWLVLYYLYPPYTDHEWNYIFQMETINTCIAGTQNGTDHGGRG